METGGGNERLAWYANLQRFYEGGWRDLSDSWAENGYASVGWRGAEASVDLDFHASRSDLTGNGLAPGGLLERDRAAVFTAPDITENDARLWTLRGDRDFGGANVAGQLSWRSNDTASFNGDGLDEDDVDELVDVGFGGVESLLGVLRGKCRESVAEGLARDGTDLGSPGEDAFVEAIGESGCSAVNNLSDREQDTLAAVLEVELAVEGAGFEHDLRGGLGYYRGRSGFESVRQFALLDPGRRSTVGPGAVGGAFGEDRTDLRTRTARRYLYFGDAVRGQRTLDGLAVGFSPREQGDPRGPERRAAAVETGGTTSGTSTGGIAPVFRLGSTTNGYVSYRQASRLPTPIELACSEELAFNPETGELEECRLPNAFLADPPLDEVVSKSLDLGLRGDRAGVSWTLGAFHTRNLDDIIWQTGQTRAHGLFRNVDETLRVGLEASAAGGTGPWRWDVGYTFVRATFEDDFEVLSPNHPAIPETEDGEGGEGEGAGTRPVRAGNSVPGIPEHLFKAAVEYAIDDRWSVGMDLVAVSSSYLRGDESNELDRLPGYVTVNAQARWRSGKFEAFVLVENLFDGDYETFGLIGEEPDEIVGLDDLGDDVRFYAPGAPASAWIGVRRRF